MGPYASMIMVFWKVDAKTWEYHIHGSLVLDSLVLPDTEVW
jgi:hypothetical protein